MAMSRHFLPPVNQYTGSYTEDVDGDGVRLNAFDHEDASIAYDPLSANRRFAGAADLAVLGTLVFAGLTCHRDGSGLFAAAGGQHRPNRLASPRRIVAGAGGRHDPLVAGGSFGSCHVSGPSFGHTGAPTSRVLGRAGPNSEAVEKYKRQQVSGLWRVDQDQHGPPHQAKTHYVPVFLAVPGAQLFAVVQI